MDHIKGFQPELCDNEFGEFWSDSLDESTPQVLFDAHYIGWHFLSPLLGSELSAISLINSPIALHRQDCTHRYLVECANYGRYT